ncbi:MAG: hypothetical protein U7126_04705 [Microcoleus sp.]
MIVGQTRPDNRHVIIRADRNLAQVLTQLGQPEKANYAWYQAIAIETSQAPRTNSVCPIKASQQRTPTPIVGTISKSTGRRISQSCRNLRWPKQLLPQCRN